MTAKRMLASMLVMASCLLSAVPASAFYNPSTGRWLNRDPIEEQSRNAYGFVDNESISFFDNLGNQKVPSNASKAKLVAKPFRFIPGNCGSVAFQIWWTLLNPTANTQGGHVVQDITITWKVTDCSDKPINPVKSLPAKWKNPGSVHYWEAWAVAKYASFSDPKDDNFNWDNEGAGTKGSVSWKGTASFYQGLNQLPKNFVEYNENTLAGPLPSTTTDPKLSNGTEPVQHEMEIEWNCCCETGQPTIKPTKINSRIPVIAQ